MDKTISSFSIRKGLKERAEQAIDNGVFPGIRNLSALIEFALEKVLSNKEEAS